MHIHLIEYKFHFFIDMLAVKMRHFCTFPLFDNDFWHVISKKTLKKSFFKP